MGSLFTNLVVLGIPPREGIDQEVDCVSLVADYRKVTVVHVLAFEIFQYKKNESVRDIPAQKIQSVRIFQCRIFSPCGYSSTENQSVGIFQYQKIRQ
jgi:hypothetical protein